MTILLNTSIGVEASGVADSARTVSITYNKAEEGLWRGNSYMSDEMDYYDNLIVDDDFLHRDSWNNNYWYLGKRVSLFTSSASYYGYKVTFTLKTDTRTNYDADYCSRAFWLVGTPTDLYNGSFASGNIGAASFTAWVPTNNSVQNIHLAPYFKFTSWEWFYADSELDTHFNYYDIYNIFTVSYTGYKTETEYENAMSTIQAELSNQTSELVEQNNKLDKQTEELENQTAELEEQTETQKGIFASIQEFFGSFFQNLIDSIVGLFVPSTDEMKELFDRLMDFFNERFGFLFYPFDFFIRIVELFMDSDGGSTAITFPGFSIMGYQIWNDTTFDLTEYEMIVDLFGYVRMLTGLFISVGFINYLKNKYDRVIRGL